MSLISALNIGSSALAVAQAQIQTTGNNIANAGNANYARETTGVSDDPDQQVSPGIFVGTGATLTDIQRQVDSALDARLNNATSDSQAANTTEQWLSQVENTFNALSGSDLSSQLQTFYGAWSNLANTPQDSGLRQVVLQDGQSVAQSFQTLRSQLGDIQSNLQQSMSAETQAADTLASQIAALNGQIVTAQGGTTGTANSLLDQRDADISSLSQLMNVTTVEQPDGSVNVYAGSEPLVTGTTSAGVAEQQQTINGVAQEVAVFKSNGEALPVTSGQIGALESAQTGISGVISQLDSLASNLIYQVNEVHASGQGLDGYTSVTSTNAVADPTAALNSPTTGLTNPPTNGSFVVHVTDAATGQQTSTLVQVSLTGQPSDTTLNSLAGSLSAIQGVSATVNGGKLTIAATNSGQQITFSQDSSGVLASLGINSFFTGTDASDIAVNSTVANNVSLIAAAQNGDAADNTNAQAMAALATQPIAALNGASLNDTYQSMINGIATQVSTAKNNATATSDVQNTLQSQRDSLSGVSLDEETVNLLQQQTAYQGAAKLISVVDQMMQTLMNMF